MRTPFIAFALLASLANAQTPIDKTMVVVNGQPISAKTYFKRMEVMPGVGQLVNDKFVAATPGYLAMSKLIDETLIIQLAKEKGIAPTDAELATAIKERTTDNPELLTALAKIGFTADDLKYETLVQLSEFKLQTMGINITDQQVELFYKEHPTMYTLPKRYKMRVIAVDTDEKKLAADAAFSAGKSFADVVAAYSIDVSKGNGGAMDDVPEGSLPGPTLAAVKSTKKGAMTDWITANGVSFRFMVDDVFEQKVVPLDAGLKADIRRAMMLQNGRVKNDVGKMMENMRKKSKIEYQNTIFDDQLKSSFGKG